MAHKVKNAAAIPAKVWNQVLAFMQTLTPDKIHAFLTTGIWPGENRIGPALKEALFTVCSLLVKAFDWWNGLESYKRGYYAGYIMFEVVTGIVGGLITGGAVPAAMLANHGPRLGKIFAYLVKQLGKLKGEGGRVAGDADFLIAKIDEPAGAIRPPVPDPIPSPGPVVLMSSCLSHLTNRFPVSSVTILN